jgi:hypothetical protein
MMSFPRKWEHRSDREHLLERTELRRDREHPLSEAMVGSTPKTAHREALERKNRPALKKIPNK